MPSFAHEAQRHADFSGNSPLSWEQFQQAKQFEHSIRYALDENTRSLIGSNQALQERHFALAQEKLGEAVTTLSLDLHSISDDIQSLSGEIAQGTAEICNALQWGFFKTNGYLVQIRDLISNPSKTWADEQFRDAVDAYRRECHEAALQYVTRAIHGHGSNTGRLTDHSFHFFLGTLRLGDWRHSEPAVVDAKLAEEAFLASARCAKVDHPLQAAIAFVCAGRAAYVQRHYERALEHTDAGLQLNESDWKGLYQAARLECLLNDDENSAEDLYEALILNPGLAIEAGAEADFDRDRSLVHNAILQARRHFQEKLDHASGNFRSTHKSIASQQLDGKGLPAVVGVELNSIVSKVEAVKKRAVEGGFLDVVDAYNVTLKELRNLALTFSLAKRRLVERLNESIRLLNERRGEQANSTKAQVETTMKIVAWVVWAGVLGAIYYFLHPYFGLWPLRFPTWGCMLLFGIPATVIVYGIFNGQASQSAQSAVHRESGEFNDQIDDLRLRIKRIEQQADPSI